jgi:guanylate kinase
VGEAVGAGGRVFIISGPGGAGKDTIVSRLLTEDDGLWLSRSWTTRALRPGESPDAYTFVDRNTFEAEIERGGFLEWAEYLGQLYGTPLPDAPPGKDVLLVIEIQGARQILERTPGAVMILIVTPSRAHQAERLRGRGDDDTQVAKRLALAIEEERLGRELAHHVVVNDDLARAVGEVAGIVAEARARPEGA